MYSFGRRRLGLGSRKPRPRLPCWCCCRNRPKTAAPTCNGARAVTKAVRNSLINRALSLGLLDDKAAKTTCATPLPEHRRSFPAHAALLADHRSGEILVPVSTAQFADGTLGGFVDMTRAVAVVLSRIGVSLADLVQGHA